MYFEEGHIYHIYNKGNNSQKIFFTQRNYIFFIEKIRKEIKPVAEILAYCLMPNHFHLMVQATAKSCEFVKKGKLATHSNASRSQMSKSAMQVLARKIGTLLSSYTQAINKQENITGSLFKQKTKAKDLIEYITYPIIKADYTKNCFFYIHKNPVEAKLVTIAEDWLFSSYIDYCEIRNGTLCNKNLAFEIIEIEKENLQYYMNTNIDSKNIW